MTDLILEEQLKAFLVTNNVVRAAKDGTGPLPWCALNLKDGPAQPTGNDTATVMLRRSGGFSTDHLEGFLEQPVVEVIVRATNSVAGVLIQRRIRTLLNDRSDFDLGQLHVQWCLLWRDAQPVPSLPGAVVSTYDTTASYSFQIRMADLVI